MSSKEAVELAFNKDVAGFREAVSNALINKIQDAVDIERVKIASSFMSDEVVEEQVEVAEEEISEETEDKE